MLLARAGFYKYFFSRENRFRIANYIRFDQKQLDVK